ncbi:MAG TPA: hypothetical protein VE988_04875, partial [Gemmataceae bacterium]|nr:hypothetical protein [Gemmataceae bacterium]
MNCREAEELLQRQLDGDLIAPPDWAEHLAACATCRELFAGARQLERGLGLLIPPKAPAILSARIVTMVMAERRRRVWRHYAAAGMLAAACLLIAFLFFLTRPSQTPYVPVIAEVPKTQPVAPAEPPLRETVKEGRDALDQLTNKVFAKVDEQAGVMGDALVPLQV